MQAETQADKGPANAECEVWEEVEVVGEGTGVRKVEVDSERERVKVDWEGKVYSEESFEFCHARNIDESGRHQVHLPCVNH